MDALLQTPDEVVLVVVVVFGDLAFYFPEEHEDRVVDRCQDNEDSDEFGSVGGNELDCGYQDHQILIDPEDTVASDVYFLVVLQLEQRYVVVSVGQLDVVLVDMPSDRLIGQRGQTLLVDPVPDHNGDESAELSLEVDQPSQAES